MSGAVTYAAVLAAFGPFRDLSRWARGEGLEIVLLVAGAILLIRMVNWLLARSASGLGGRALWSLHPAPPLDDAARGPDVRRRQALTQAMGWLSTALIILVVGGLVAVRFGVPLSTVVPPATVAGVAVGFGAQRIVQDVLSGFFLALDVGIVRVRVVARVRASDQWSAGRELRLRIASGLAEAGITPLMPMLVPGAGE